MEYELIRSRRKTLEISVLPGGALRVRAPLRMSVKQIETFLRQKESWIAEKQARMAQLAPPRTYSPAEIAQMKARTLERVRPRVEHFARLMGVTPTSVSVTSAQKRWGSCSSTGKVHFSFLLAEQPPEFIDSVVVHELCHLVHHDHSPAFWDMVRRYDVHFRSKRYQPD